MPSGAAGQDSTYPRMPGMAGSTNVEVLSHITLGTGDVSDIEVEQDDVVIFLGKGIGQVAA